MLFQHVSIASIAHVDAPNPLSSADINARLRPTLDRLGIRTDVLGDIAGIHSRRFWEDGTQASDAATAAAEKALADIHLQRDKIGLLVNTSVSRDFLEPSTASIVSGNLGLPDTCQNFDLANACLAFINGMDIASRMIERGEIEYALVVDGETANLAYEKTLARMCALDVTEEQFRQELATLTLGCGAAAMVLARRELVPDAPRYKGGVTRAATQWNTLCRGNLDRMVTDTRMLLIEGIKSNVFLHDGRQWLTPDLQHAAQGVGSRALGRSDHLDARLGGEVGYQVRFENITSRETRLTYVTEGVMLRMMLEDPQLDRVGCIVIDEFHERHLDGDLVLAFARRLQRKRPDLKIIVMSATLVPGPLVDFMQPCKLLESEGRTFPVEIRYQAPLQLKTGYPEPIWDQAARACEDLANSPGFSGDMLVFIHMSVEGGSASASRIGYLDKPSANGPVTFIGKDFN